MKNGDPEDVPPEENRKPSRVARDPGPSRAAKMTGTAIGMIGALAGAISAARASGDSGSAMPPNQEHLLHESTLPNDLVSRSPGVMTIEDLKADMAAAQEAINQNPALQARLERNLREVSLDKATHEAVERFSSDAYPDDAQRSSPEDSDPFTAVLNQLAAPAFSGTAGTVAVGIAVEILTAVKKELVSRVAKETVDLLLPQDDQAKPTGATPGVASTTLTDTNITGQQLEEIREHLLEIINIISRGQAVPIERQAVERPATAERSVR